MTKKATEELKEIRRRITEIDNKMAELFTDRMEQVKKVGEYKKINGIPIYDPEREEQVLKNGSERIQEPELKSYYVSFLKNLMEIARRYQSNILEGLKVGYSGTEGALRQLKEENATVLCFLLKTALPEMWIK